MSTEQTADSQPAVADEVNPNRHVVIRILARHDCEGRLDTQTMQVDQSSTAVSLPLYMLSHAALYLGKNFAAFNLDSGM